MAKTKIHKAASTTNAPRETVGRNWNIFEQIISVARQSLGGAWVELDNRVGEAVKSAASHAVDVGRVIAALVAVFELYRKANGSLPKREEVQPHLLPLMTFKSEEVSEQSLAAAYNRYRHLTVWSSEDLMNEAEKKLYAARGRGAVIDGKLYPDPLTALAVSGASFTAVHDAFWHQTFSEARSNAGRKTLPMDKAVTNAVAKLQVRGKNKTTIKPSENYDAFKVALTALVASWSGKLTAEQHAEVQKIVTTGLGKVYEPKPKQQTQPEQQAQPPAETAAA